MRLTSASKGCTVERGRVPALEHPVDFVIERLREVLEQSPEALEAGAIVAVEDGRHRVRHLPP